jgi:hypothetical protein
MAEQDLTRRTLYDLVWSRPITKVAEEFGISDVGLKKICEKHPRPDAASWLLGQEGRGPTCQTDPIP